MYKTCSLMVIHPCANIWYAYVKEQRHLASNPWWKYNLILRSNVKVIQSACMYVTHRSMVTYLRPKQSMIMSKDKKAETWTQSHVINPKNLTLRSKVKVVSEYWIYLSHPFMVIDPSAKYGMTLSKLTEVTGRIFRHDKSL